jgi:large subunit ribosomal protein L23
MFEIIISPIFTEKSTSLLLIDKYFFDVPRKTTKTQLRVFIEKIFSVQILNINIYLVPGKKSTGPNSRKKRKIAVVSLREGYCFK